MSDAENSDECFAAADYYSLLAEAYRIRRKFLAARIRSLRIRACRFASRKADIQQQRSLQAERLKLSEAFGRWLQEAESNCLSLALRVAGSILEKEVAAPEYLIAEIKSALSELRQEFDRICVPSDSTTPVARELPNLRIERDPEIFPGTARIELQGGALHIDYRIELRRIEALLKTALAEKHRGDHAAALGACAAPA